MNTARRLDGGRQYRPPAALILAGGAARRLGGAAKPLLAVEGTALLQLVLDAVRGAEPVVVVGPAAWGGTVQEDPPAGGPVAAIRAGLDVVPADVELIAILAADLPFLTPAVVGGLTRAVGTADVALLVDDQGRRQNLVGVWRTRPLRAALSQDPGPAIRDVLRRLTVVEVAPPEGGLPAWFDCDTAEDLAQARKLARAQKPSSSSSDVTAER